MFVVFAHLYSTLLTLAAFAAVAVGLPQGLGFEATTVFEVATVALAATVMPLVVGYGLLCAVRDERQQVAARRDAELRRQLSARKGWEL